MRSCRGHTIYLRCERDELNIGVASVDSQRASRNDIGRGQGCWNEGFESTHLNATVILPLRVGAMVSIKFIGMRTVPPPYLAVRMGSIHAP